MFGKGGRKTKEGGKQTREKENRQRNQHIKGRESLNKDEGPVAKEKQREREQTVKML